MSTNLIIQYTVVVILVLAAIARIIWNIHRHNKGKSTSGCCGCSLAESCTKKRINE